MNKPVQIMNRSLCLSISLHLIGAAFAAFLVIGTTHKHGDTISAEFVSVSATKPRMAQRQLKTPARLQPDFAQTLPQRLQVRTEPLHISKPAPEFMVDTLQISDVQQPLSTPGGIGAEKTLQRSLPSRSLYLGSEWIHLPETSVPRPERNTPFRLIESAAAAELPPISIQSSQPIQNARFFRKVDPIYPESARLSHQQGLVVLEATIGTDGIAREIRVVKVVEVIGLGCEEAAIAALKASRFVPAKQGETPIRQRLRIPYRFQFKN